MSNIIHVRKDYLVGGSDMPIEAWQKTVSVGVTDEDLDTIRRVVDPGQVVDEKSIYVREVGACHDQFDRAKDFFTPGLLEAWADGAQYRTILWNHEWDDPFQARILKAYVKKIAGWVWLLVRYWLDPQVPEHALMIPRLSRGAYLWHSIHGTADTRVPVDKEKKPVEDGQPAYGHRFDGKSPSQGGVSEILELSLGVPLGAQQRAGLRTELLTTDIKGAQNAALSGVEKLALRCLIRGAQLEGEEEADKAAWTVAYINRLPDSAFAAIEPGGKKDEEGKTVPRSYRHLPHHDGEGDLGEAASNANLDAAHYRNARARANQIKAVSGNITDADLRAKAQAHLERHAKLLAGKTLTTKVYTDEEAFADGEVVVREGTWEDVTKPYPNEHACRINDPGKYKSFNRVNCRMKEDDRCIDVIFGILAPGKSEIQSFRYPLKAGWAASAASKHCHDHGGKAFEPATGKKTEGVMADAETKTGLPEGWEPVEGYEPIKTEALKELRDKVASLEAEAEQLKLEAEAGRIYRKKVIDELERMSTSLGVLDAEDKDAVKASRDGWALQSIDALEKLTASLTPAMEAKYPGGGPQLPTTEPGTATKVVEDAPDKKKKSAAPSTKARLVGTSF